MWGLLKLMNFIPDSPLSLGIDECVMAVVVYFVTFLFMGKEKVSFSTKGLGYAFRLLRGYFIFMGCLMVLGITSNILESVVKKTASSYQLLPFINILLAGLFVGIVEEFTFRGLMFGGLLQKFGNTKKSIITAALISGFTFAALHVLGSVLGGDVTDYVTTDSSQVGMAIGAYVIFTLVLVPAFVRCIKDIKPGEAVPFDDDFLPRKVEFVKKSKKKKDVR